MSKFKRKSTKFDEDYNKYMSPLYYTGFINEEIFNPDATNRCIWTKFKELISDVNCATIYSSVLAAHKKIPYTEEEIQNIELKGKGASNTRYSNLSAIPYVIQDCKFIAGNALYYNDEGKIDRALAKIEHYRELGYEINEAVIKNLYMYKNEIRENGSRYNKAMLETTGPIIIDTSNEKELMNEMLEVKILVPLLTDNKCYNISGIKKYPVYSDLFNYSSDKFGQTAFVFKTFKKKISKKKSTSTPILRDGRFRYTRLLNGNKIFYMRIFKNYFNPFSYLDDSTALETYTRILTYIQENGCKEGMKEILDYTYQKRKDFQNSKFIPLAMNDQVDQAFEEENFKSFQRDSIIKDEEMINEDHKTEKAHEESNEPEHQEISLKKLQQEGTKSHVSPELVEDLIKGYISKKQIVKMYAHFGELLFRRSDIQDGSDLKSNYYVGQNSTSLIIPKPTVLLEELLMNSYMFTTNDSVNPIDCFVVTSYRKYVYSKTLEKSKIFIPIQDRFLSNPYDRIIESLTSKSSEENIGINGYINGLNYYRKQVLNS